MTINAMTDPIEDVKSYAKDELNMRIAQNTSDKKTREKVQAALAKLETKNNQPEPETSIIDFSKPFGKVRGMPGVSFYQNGNNFKSDGSLA